MASVIITQDKADIGRAIDEALEGIPELERLVRDKVVAVKPNETYANEKDQSGLIQPDTLRAVIKHLKRFSPRELVVSGGAGAGETDEIFEVAGLMDVMRQEGVTFVDHNRPPFREVALEYRRPTSRARNGRSGSIRGCSSTRR